MQPSNDKHAGDPIRAPAACTTTRRWRTEKWPLANGGLESSPATCDGSLTAGSVGIHTIYSCELLRVTERRIPKTFPSDQCVDANRVALHGLALPEDGAGDGNRTHREGGSGPLEQAVWRES
jgi:hypothetical protein